MNTKTLCFFSLFVNLCFSTQNILCQQPEKQDFVGTLSSAVSAFNEVPFDASFLIEIIQFRDTQKKAIANPQILKNLSEEKLAIRVDRFLVRWIRTRNNQMYHVIKSVSDGTDFFEIRDNHAVQDIGVLSRQITFKYGQWKNQFIDQPDQKILIDRIVARPAQGGNTLPANQLPMAVVTKMAKEIENVLGSLGKEGVSLEGKLLRFSSGERGCTVELDPLNGFLPSHIREEYANSIDKLDEQVKYSKIKLDGREISFPSAVKMVRTFEGQPFYIMRASVLTISDAPKDLIFDKQADLNPSMLISSDFKNALIAPPELTEDLK